MKRVYQYILLLLFVSIHTAQYGQTSSENLSRQEVDSLARVYFSQAINKYADEIESNWQAGVLKSDGFAMPFDYSIKGEYPERGYPLYISMHGGGDTTAEDNDLQWENQKTLYGVVEGVYFVPRAPTDTWNMWHQSYMDDFIVQVISYSVARLGVDPTRVYLLGYSAGGDGVYNLAPRLSDRLAAAAMMAGHPGDAQIENLRNLPFAIYVGAEDTAYNRYDLAVEWLRNFERLNEMDQNGFQYHVNIYAGKGHWMDGEDGEAIGWLATHRRICNPDRVIWIQDDVLATHKHNLEVSNPQVGFRVEQRVDYSNNTIYIYSEHYSEVTIWLDDFIVNLDKDVIVVFNGAEVFRGAVAREEQNIIQSINTRLDAEYIYWGKVKVAI